MLRCAEGQWGTAAGVPPRGMFPGASEPPQKQPMAAVHGSGDPSGRVMGAGVVPGGVGGVGGAARVV